MFFSLLINFFVTTYIFLSADGKIAYLYDDVIFICSSDYFLYQKYVYRKVIKKGVKIIIFKA